jgi:hypothetical protein
MRSFRRAPAKETSNGEIAVADDDASASSESYYSDDDESSGLGSGVNGDDESSRDEEKEIQLIIRNENKAVVLWREIVTGMLVITAALVTVTTYIFLSREEVDDFSRGVSPSLVKLQHQRVVNPGDSWEIRTNLIYISFYHSFHSSMRRLLLYVRQWKAAWTASSGPFMV